MNYDIGFQLSSSIGRVFQVEADDMGTSRGLFLCVLSKWTLLSL